jgi:hypothetical protein
MAHLLLTFLEDALGAAVSPPGATSLLLLGFTQGLVHAVGPDHCAAMATLNGMGPGGAGGSAGRRARALSTALRFAVGHTLVLGGMAAVCLSAGVVLSEAFTRWAEVAGGAVLTAIALTALLAPSALRHGHPHLPGHGHDHHHPPHPDGASAEARGRQAHARTTGAAGALMAVSGVRALLLPLMPLLVGGRFSLEAWSYLPGFALGILVGMGAVGMLLGEGLSRLSARLGAWVERLVYAGSAALGVAWVVARL